MERHPIRIHEGGNLLQRLDGINHALAKAAGPDRHHISIVPEIEN